MTTNEILSMDINAFLKLSYKELKPLTQKLSSTANLRIKRMVDNEISSPAVAKILTHGGLFTTKGKNLNQLRQEFTRAKSFLESQTSTITGYKKWKRKTISRMKDRNISITEKEFFDFWNIYNQLEERHPDIQEKSFKYKVMTAISKMMQDKRRTVKSIVRKMEAELDDIETGESEWIKDYDPRKNTGFSQYFKHNTTK